ncbi:MAG TPA: YihY/virulence factor BrkB family protein [Candidatus Thermoplasmatota archaeon]|nr:YihY/virulence factor BrkB family protein [Candidatus Thermoplasmatota archaeon]
MATAQESFRWRPRQVGTLLARTLQEWMEDKSPRQAAALAYYTLFALGPLLVVAAALAGLAFGQEAARQAITGKISALAGDEAGQAIASLMAGGFRGGAGLVGLVVGSVLLVFGAIGVFAQLREALNRTWEVEEKAVAGWRNKLATAVRKNVLGFAGVLGTGFLLLVSLAIGAGLQALATYARGLLPGPDLLWQAANLAATVAVCGVVFALMFKFLPNAKTAWRDVWVGGTATALLFVVGELAIGAYLGQGTMVARYGGAGALLAVLLWVYYSSLILLFGAELTQVYANLHGSRIRPSRRGEAMQEAIAKRDAPPHLEGTESKPGKQPQRGSRPRRHRVQAKQAR